MIKPIIAIDIDDTIAESTETLRKLVNHRAGVDLPSEAYTVEGEYWGYYERVWAMNGLSGISHADFEAEMEVDQSHVPLLPSAEYAIKILSETYRIVLVTARDISLEGATRTWLKTHFPYADIELYFSEARKDQTKMTKGQLCKQLGARLLIDDNIQHCESAVELGIDTVLFGDYGWNRTNTSLKRCYNWQEVIEYLDGAKL
ncbi:MAG: hypothetical protein WAW60_00200 [Candidatus Saccharimonadales bacterium]